MSVMNKLDYCRKIRRITPDELTSLCLVVCAWGPYKCLVSQELYLGQLGKQIKLQEREREREREANAGIPMSGEREGR